MKKLVQFGANSENYIKHEKLHNSKLQSISVSFVMTLSQQILI